MTPIEMKFRLNPEHIATHALADAVVSVSVELPTIGWVHKLCATRGNTKAYHTYPLNDLVDSVNHIGVERAEEWIGCVLRKLLDDQTEPAGSDPTLLAHWESTKARWKDFDPAANPVTILDTELQELRDACASGRQEDVRLELFDICQVALQALMVMDKKAAQGTGDSDV